MTHRKLILEILIISAISLSFLFIFSSYVPFNPDEFFQYHALACRYYPLNMLNTFRESCAGYDISSFRGCFLPLRSYAYVGSFPCIIYYPLFKLWPSPYSARLLGLIMLALQSIILYKLFRINTVFCFIALLAYMPYAFQHVVDTGPTALATTSIFLICYLARGGIFYSLLIALTIIIGIWTKFTYLALIPGIATLIFYYRRNLKTFIWQALISAAIIMIPAVVILNSKSRDGVKLFYKVMKISQAAHAPDSEFLMRNLGRLTGYFMNPLAAAHRVFHVEGGISAIGILAILLTVALFIYGITLCRRMKISYSFPLLNIFLFFLTFLLIAGCVKSWAMHHVVLALPFLVLAFFYLASKLYRDKFFMFLAGAFLALNLSLYAAIPALKYREHDHPSKILLNNLLNKGYAKDYVFIVIDWGMYYMKSLYGDKDQCVLYIDPFRSKEEADEVKAILRRTNRKALFIGRTNCGSNLSLIKREFPGLVELKTDFPTGTWRVWYEPRK